LKLLIIVLNSACMLLPPTVDDEHSERTYFAADLRREFEAGGVHLRGKDKQALLDAQVCVYIVRLYAC
jgi:hypothetical protein